MTKEKLSKSLSGVARLRHELDGETDVLNRKIAEFEKEFGLIAGGTRVEVVTMHDAETHTHESLVFSRYNGTPRLLLVDGSTPEDVVTPLASASRAERLMAVNYFPQLIHGLEKALQEQLNEVAMSTRLADECIEVVREANQSRTLREDLEAAYDRVDARTKGDAAAVASPGLKLPITVAAVLAASKVKAGSSK